LTDEPVLNPANWSLWWPYLLVMLALEVAYVVWVYRGGTWTHTVTLVNATLGVLYTGPLVWLLATHRFFNPKFVQELDWRTADPLYWLTTIAITVVVLTAVWDVAEVAIKAERTRRGLLPVATLNADTATRALRSLPLAAAAHAGSRSPRPRP
jgi:hypothetical protein